MSSQTQAKSTQPKNNTARRTNRRGRGKNTPGPVEHASTVTSQLAKVNGPVQAEETSEENTAVDLIEEEADATSCWICAEPSKYFSLSECNHRTCHVCALRLRALYKKLDCTFCKHPQNNLVFTASSDTQFEAFNLEEMQYKDAKLSIYFETQEIMEESLILLRFNCPDPDCPSISRNWDDLKNHVKLAHGKMMCYLCIRFKKVFAHEHILYSSNQLYAHMPSLSHRPNKTLSKDKVEGGVHPLCEFCRECFFGDDELYAHMRERHEECFICKRQGIQHQYFQNYNSLEAHFGNSHHPCKSASCLERKFVVFGSLMDLKAHMMEEHGAQMTTKDMKDARRVEVDMEYEDSRGAGGRRRGGREREPPPGPPPIPPEQDFTRASNRRAGFNGTLTGDDSGTGRATPITSHASPSATDRDLDPETARKHAAFMARVANITSDSTAAATVFKAAIRSYRSSEQSAKDLISIFYSRLNEDLEATSSLIIPLIDILDNDEKKQDLLETFNGFKIEHRQEFPELTNHGPEPAYAGVASGRVLNVKHSTAPKRNKGQVWDRVARAASSSLSSTTGVAGPSSRPAERFPALHRAQTPTITNNTTARTQPAFRPPSHVTPWTSSAASTAPALGPKVRSEAKGKASGGSVNLSNAAFPALPTATARAKPPVRGNQSLRNIVGNPGPTVNVWSTENATGLDNNANGVDVTVADELTQQAPSNVQQKKGKKKGKEKVTLFTLGTFPS